MSTIPDFLNQFVKDANNTEAGIADESLGSQIAFVIEQSRINQEPAIASVAAMPNAESPDVDTTGNASNQTLPSRDDFPQLASSAQPTQQVEGSTGGNLKDEVARIHSVIDHLDRNALLSSMHSKRSVSSAMMFRVLREEDRKNNIWDDVARGPAPEWFLNSMRSALRAVYGRTQPLNPVQESNLETAHPLALLNTLRTMRPTTYAELIEHHAKQQGLDVQISDESRNRYDKVIEQHGRHQQLINWLKEANLPESGYEVRLFKALEKLPATSDWMARLTETVVENRDAPNKPLAKESGIKVSTILEKDAVFHQIPTALNEEARRLTRYEATVLDQHYPSNMLYALARVAKNASRDQNRDLKEFLALLPKNRETLTHEQKTVRDRVYRNIGIMSLRGVEGLNEELQRGVGPVLGGMMWGLTKDDLAQPVHTEQSKERFEGIKRHLQKTLLQMPESYSELFRFLLGAKTDEAQIRMLGMHLSANPYRTLLLKPGPLCIRGFLDESFDHLMERSYKEREASNVERVVFDVKDIATVRQKALEVRWADNTAVGKIVPLLTWLQAEGERMIQQAQLLDPTFVSQTIEKMSVYPDSSPRNSLASLCLGCTMRGGATDTYKDLRENPVTLGLYLMGSVDAVCIEGQNPQSNTLLTNPAWQTADQTRLHLDAIKDWSGSPEQWNVFCRIMEHPSFQLSLPDTIMRDVQKKLADAFELDPTKKFPVIEYTQGDRENLREIFSGSWGKEVLFAPPTPKPDMVVYAAALMEKGEDLPNKEFWAPHIERLKRDVSEFQQIEYNPIPGIRGSRSVTLSEWNPAALEKATRTLFGLREPAPLNSLGQPSMSEQSDVAWNDPTKWMKAVDDLRHRKSQVTRILGEGSEISHLSRLLYFMASVHQNEATMLEKAGSLASKLLGDEPGKAPIMDKDLSQQLTEIGKLLEGWRGMGAKVVLSVPGNTVPTLTVPQLQSGSDMQPMLAP